VTTTVYTVLALMGLVFLFVMGILSIPFYLLALLAVVDALSSRLTEWFSQRPQ